MEGTKLDISGRKDEEKEPLASYKAVPESDDMEDDVVSRSKNPKIVKTKSETDGAHEKMLPDDDCKNCAVEICDKKILSIEKQNGDAKLDIGDLKSAFVGMTKEELMKYANDPFWVRIRWLLFILFWVLWAGMLIGAIAIIYAAPKCEPPAPHTWWQTGPLVEIEDNVGPGHLQLLKDNEVNGVVVDWTGDAYEMISDIHDFAELLQTAKEKGLNTIVGLNPALCTSTVWFNKSENDEYGYSDYFIWREGKFTSGNITVPNNWVSPLNISSWKYSEKRKLYYYAPLGKPHLNLRNKNVSKEFEDALKKFINLGATGIKIIGANRLLVDSTFENEPVLPFQTEDVTPNSYALYSHTKTENVFDLGPLFANWRNIVRTEVPDGPLVVSEFGTQLDSFKVNNSLAVDLVAPYVDFSRHGLNATGIKYHLNYIYKIQNLSWPLWKVSSEHLPIEGLGISLFLMPGTPLNNSFADKELTNLRSSPPIVRGSFDYKVVANGTVFAYTRTLVSNPGYLVALNPTNQSVVVNFLEELPLIPEEVTIEFCSRNYNESGFELKQKKDSSNIRISAQSSIVLTYVPKH